MHTLTNCGRLLLDRHMHTFYAFRCCCVWRILLNWLIAKFATFPITLRALSMASGRLKTPFKRPCGSPHSTFVLHFVMFDLKTRFAHHPTSLIPPPAPPLMTLTPLFPFASSNIYSCQESAYGSYCRRCVPCGAHPPPPGRGVRPQLHSLRAVGALQRKEVHPRRPPRRIHAHVILRYARPGVQTGRARCNVVSVLIRC